MRINKFVAQATGLSRRAADDAIAQGRVFLNGRSAIPGDDVSDKDTPTLDGKPLIIASNHTTIVLHKPVGYVVSRNGQGSATVYDLLPIELHALKPIGRLDKNSSGLLLLTDDGGLAFKLTHPSQQKRKVYQVTLNAPLQPLHRQLIHERGIALEDGTSKLQLERQYDNDDTSWIITMREGRNRQIRRTFEALGYSVILLHRTTFGDYSLDTIPSGSYLKI